MSALFVAAMLAGCSVPLEIPAGVGPVNTCSANGDCGLDAACVEGKCVATSYDLANILLQVRPQTGSSLGAGTSYVIDPGAAGVPLVSSATGGQPFAWPFSFELPAPVSIHGGKVLLTNTKACNTTDGSVPAQVTFYRVPQLAGLPFDPIRVTTILRPGPSYAFDADLVNDRYDVYIEPQTDPNCPTAIPPYFLAGQSITSTVSWTLPSLGTLSGTIAGLVDPTAWKVDVVEPVRGLPVSTGSTLAIGPTSATVTAQIFAIDPNAWPIVRLTPVDPTDPKSLDPTRPIVYWSLQVGAHGGTLANPIVALSIEDLTVTPTTVQGQVLGPDGKTGILARLSIQSQTLNGANAGNASFSAGAVQTQTTGSFLVGLPPGTYSVRIFPTVDGDDSISDRQINVPASSGGSSCDCGIPLLLDTRAKIAGPVTTSDGRPLGSTSAGIAPSQALSRSYLASMHALGLLEPRAETTITDASGGFTLLADRGAVDLTIQTDPSSDLPWLVIPQISPDPAAAQRPLKLPSPAFLHGNLYDPQGPIANAEIDAWYPVRNPDDPSILLGTVVKIGTTSTDANGAYVLVLPSSVPARGLK
jgi:hypothetical protein